METLIHYLLLVVGVVTGAIVCGTAFAFIGVYLLRLWKRTRGVTVKVTADAEKSPAAKGFTDKVKKAVSEKPPWLVTLTAVAGGWLFFLLSLYILLPSVWQWFLRHPEFLWMPPLVIFAAQALYASKKNPAKYLAYAITLVLLIAFVNALPWRWGSGGDGASTHPAGEQATISAMTRWRDCIEIPYTTSKRTDVVKITAPVGIQSPCYLIRDGYWSRITPKSPSGTVVRLSWHDGRVLDLREHGSTATHLGNSVRNAAFVMMSLGEKPAAVVVRLEKK